MSTRCKSAALALIATTLTASGCDPATARPDAAAPAGRAESHAAGSSGKSAAPEESDADSGPADHGDPTLKPDAGPPSADLDGGEDDPRRTYFWGEIDVSVPATFAHSPSRDTITLSFDAEQRLRWLSWNEVPTRPKTFGTALNEFPWQGTRRVDLQRTNNTTCDATVEDGSVFTAAQFQLRTHVVCPGLVDDYMESIEGTRTQAGWHVVYSEQGKLGNSDITIHGEGDIYARPPGVNVPAVGSVAVWSAPVDVSSSGQHLVAPVSVRLDADGSLRAFSVLARHFSFGTGPQDLPRTGQGSVSDLNVTVEESRFTTSEFLMRQHGVSTAGAGPDALTDYIESFSGKRVGDDLLFSYSFRGKLYGATFDNQAEGTLVPSPENSQIQAGAAWDGTYACHGDTLSSDSCSAPLTGDWTLDLGQGQLTIKATGYDQAEYRCDGAWTGSDFLCKLAWSRSGRQCSSDSVKVRAEGAGKLTFWLFDKSGTAVCQRQ